MAAKELGRRVADDVCTPLDRPAEVRCGKRIIDDEWQPSLMGDLRDRLEVDDDAAGIGQALDENGLAARRERLAEILRLRGIDEMAGPAELLERETELGQRPAVEVARGKELVPRLHQRVEDEELSRMARCGRHRGTSALQD